MSSSLMISGPTPICPSLRMKKSHINPDTAQALENLGNCFSEKKSLTRSTTFLAVESLTNILHNNTCAQTLSRLRGEAKQVIDELGRNKDLLESMLQEKLQEIDARRRELDSLECKAVEDMLREDKEYKTQNKLLVYRRQLGKGHLPLSMILVRKQK